MGAAAPALIQAGGAIVGGALSAKGAKDSAKEQRRAAEAGTRQQLDPALQSALFGGFIPGVGEQRIADDSVNPFQPFITVETPTGDPKFGGTVKTKVPNPQYHQFEASRGTAGAGIEFPGFVPTAVESFAGGDLRVQQPLSPFTTLGNIGAISAAGLGNVLAPQATQTLGSILGAQPDFFGGLASALPGAEAEIAATARGERGIGVEALAPRFSGRVEEVAPLFQSNLQTAFDEAIERIQPGIQAGFEGAGRTGSPLAQRALGLGLGSALGRIGADEARFLTGLQQRDIEARREAERFGLGLEARDIEARRGEALRQREEQARAIGQITGQERLRAEQEQQARQQQLTALPLAQSIGALPRQDLLARAQIASGLGASLEQREMAEQLGRFEELQRLQSLLQGTQSPITTIGGQAPLTTSPFAAGLGGALTTFQLMNQLGAFQKQQQQPQTGFGQFNIQPTQNPLGNDLGFGTFGENPSPFALR